MFFWIMMETFFFVSGLIELDEFLQVRFFFLINSFVLSLHCLWLATLVSFCQLIIFKTNLMFLQ